jgi:hypothetical protein
VTRVLAAQVPVQNPQTGQFVTLQPGDELPDWAEKLVTNPKAFVGEGDGLSPETVAAPAVVTDPEKDQLGNEVPEGASFPDGEPSPSWTVAQLREFAEENAVDLGGATVKDDILDALRRLT